MKIARKMKWRIEKTVREEKRDGSYDCVCYFVWLLFGVARSRWSVESSFQIHVRGCLKLLLSTCLKLLYFTFCLPNSLNFNNSALRKNVELGSTPPFWWSSQIATPQNIFLDVNVEFMINYPPMLFVTEK